MQEILSPVNGWIFKLLFGDKRNRPLLISFLKAFINLPDEEYDIIFVDTNFSRIREEFEMAAGKHRDIRQAETTELDLATVQSFYLP